MKFNLNDFIELDTKELLGVNGGGGCSGTSSLSGGKSNGNQGSKKTGGSLSGSGDKPARNSGSPSTGGSSGGGGCSSTSSLIGGKPDSGKQESPKTGGSASENDGEKVYPVKYGPRNGWWGVTEWSDGSFINEKGERVYPEKNKSNGSSSHSGGGYCSGASDGKTLYKNPYYSNPDNGNKSEAEQNGVGASGGGSSSSGSSNTQAEETGAESGSSDTPDVAAESVSGKFGQITDGSYADKLTMQYYKNNKEHMFHPGAKDDAMNGKYKGKDGKEHECTFSKVGCKEVASAKIASEMVGDDVPLVTVNNIFDANKDGDLSSDEIAAGIDKLLDIKYGDVYDVDGKDITDKINLEKLNEISGSTDGSVTYVLGFAPSCHDGHWVVLEGYSKDSNGVVSFNYDGTSDNDKGRSFVLGTAHQDSSKEIWGITRIQTFTVRRR